jgi:hypothetical protein
MLESEYQAKLIKKLRRIFPDCLILKNDPEYLQGIPDLLILHNDRWALLEVKASENADTRPNQQYYVDRGNELSYAAFIYPENEKEVLDDLRSTFRTSR